MAKTPAQPPENPPSPQQGGAYRLNANNELEPLNAPQSSGSDAAPATTADTDPATKE